MRNLRQDRHCGDNHYGTGGGADRPDGLAPACAAVHSLECAKRRRQRLDVGAQPGLDRIVIVGHDASPTAALSLARA
jgi:hypothetical protein